MHPWKRFWASLFLAILGALLAPQVAAAPGDLDTLNLSIVGTSVNATVEQPDGKIVIAGSFTSVLGQTRNNIARLNANGTLDSNFDPNANGAVNCVLLQADGKMLLGGSFTTLQPFASPAPVTRNRVARLNVDGTLDMTYDPNFTSSTAVHGMVVQTDGKAFVGGAFTQLRPNGGSYFTKHNLVRLNVDGTVDTSFDLAAGGTVHALALQPDGQLLLGGAFSGVGSVTRGFVARTAADGTVDTRFNPNASSVVYSIVVQPDGRLLLGGAFLSLQPNGTGESIPRRRVARINVDGTVDMGFDPNAGAEVQTVVLQSDGKVLLGGYFTTLQPNGAATTTPRNRVARLNADGTLDLGFNPNADNVVNCLALQSDGRVLVGGTFGSLQPNGAASATSRSRFARLLNDAAEQSLTVVDASVVTWTRGGSAPNLSCVRLELSTDNGENWTLLPALPQAVNGWRFGDLSLPVAGTVRARGHNAAGRYGGSGSRVEQSTVFNGLAPVPVEIVVEGNGTTIRHESTRPTVADHTDFGDVVFASSTSAARTFTVRNTGAGNLTLTGQKVAISGEHAADFSVTWQPPATVGAGGSTTFGVSFVPSAPGLRSAVVSIASDDPDENPYVFAIQGSGVLPGHFDPLDLKISGTVYTTVEQPDGKIIVGGSFSSILGMSRTNLARINADGTLDSGFDPRPNDKVYCVALQTDGRILLGGEFLSLQPNGTGAATTRNRVARLNADGTLDTGFNLNVSATASRVRALALQGDGKIILVGSFSTLSPNGAGVVSRENVARVNADGMLDVGFDYGAAGEVYCVAVQADGKILLGGAFAAVRRSGGAGSVSRMYMARINGDNTVDMGFEPAPNSNVYCLMVQPDGKVLLGGAFTRLQPNGAASPTTRKRIARLNADGSVDMGFDPCAADDVYSVDVHSMALQTDGKVILGGSFATLQPNGAATAVRRLRAARVNQDGTLDMNFDPGVNGTVYSVALQADGRVLLGGGIAGLAPNGAGFWTPRARLARLFNDDFRTTFIVGDASVAFWLRGGTGPEFDSVTLDLSVDNAQTWTPIGRGRWMTGGWRVDDLTLPGAGMLRARGTVTGGYGGGSRGLVEQVASFSGVGPAPVEIVVQGNGRSITAQDPVPTLEDHRDFGGVVTTGSATMTRTFTVKNTGTGDLLLNGAPQVVVGGMHAADFTVTAQPAAVVAGGGSTTFQIRFKPSATGARTATVSIPSNDPDEDLFVFGILGSGKKAGEVDPLDFDADEQGSIVQGRTAVEQLDGKIIIGGLFTSVQGQPRSRIARINADGTLDAGFDPKANGAVNCVMVQPDGKILLGGLFTTLQPNGAAVATTRNRMARLNADGTLDTSFDPNVSGTAVNCMALQPDGKILVGGGFSTVGGLSRGCLVRLNVDGSVDTSFDPRVSAIVHCMVVQPDGKIVFGGGFLSLQPYGGLSYSRDRVARVNADGTADATFNPKANGIVYSMALQADGKVLLGGAFSTLQPNNAGSSTSRLRIARVNGDGTLDAGFDPSAGDSVMSIAVQTDGKVLFGGSFSSLQPNGSPSLVTRKYVARVNADGTVDGGFDPNPFSLVSSVTLRADGRVLLAGYFNSLFPNGPLNGTVRAGFAQLLNEAGTQTLTVGDASVVSWARGGAGPELTEVAFDLSVDNGSTWAPLRGTRVAGGWRAGDLSLPSTGIVRVRGYSTGGIYSGSGSPVEQMAAFSGLDPVPVEIIVEGNGVSIPHEDSTPSLLDHTDFGGVEVRGTGAATRTFTVRNSGTQDLVLNGSRLVAQEGPQAADFSITALPAASVPPGGSTTFQVTFDPSGGGARTATLRIASNDADESPHVFTVRGRGLVAGDLDTLDPGMVGTVVNAIAEQADGKVILGGIFSSVRGLTRNNLARLNADGTLDTGFDPNANGEVACVAVLPDGRVLLGGGFTSVAGAARNGLARLNADGTLDAGFDANVGGSVNCVTVDAAGRLLVGGLFNSVGGVTRNNVARLNADGTVDASFDPNANDLVNNVTLQADGKVLLGGSISTMAPNGGAFVIRQGIARVHADGTLDAGFDPRASSTVNVDGTVSGMALQADGRVLIGGRFNTMQPNGADEPETRNLFARLLNDAATQTLSVPAVNDHTWTRGGAAQEVEGVTFDLSVDGGGTWTLLGPGVRGAGGWRCPGALLPSTGRLRARGRAMGGCHNGSSGMVEQITAFSGLPTPPTLAAATATGINGTSAILGGEVTTDGGGAGVTERGVVYALSAANSNPLLNGAGVTQVANASATTGVFTVVANGLLPGSAYSFRAYATNSLGTHYSMPVSTFTTLNNNATLASLTLASATLQPAFAPGTLGYSATVPNGTSNLAFAATAQDTHAVVGGDASPKALAVGSNMLTILVTAEDGTTQQAYSVTITRQTAAQTAISTWATGMGVAPGLAGLLDDPDGDGLPNLIEFAFGTGPTNAGGGVLSYDGNEVRPGQPVVASETSGDVTTRRALFVRRADHASAGITYTVGFSAGLLDWEASAEAPTVLADDGMHQVVSVPFPENVGGSEARFFRVSVGTAP